MGAYTKSLRSYQLAERDSLLRQRRCAVALAKRLARRTKLLLAMGAYTKSLRSYQLAERDSLLRQRRCAVALAKRLASHTAQSPVDTTVLTIGACVDTTGATVGAAVDTTSRSASSQRAITSGSQ